MGLRNIHVHLIENRTGDFATAQKEGEKLRRRGTRSALFSANGVHSTATLSAARSDPFSLREVTKYEKRIQKQSR